MKDVHSDRRAGPCHATVRNGLRRCVTSNSGWYRAAGHIGSISPPYDGRPFVNLPYASSLYEPPRRGGDTGPGGRGPAVGGGDTPPPGHSRPWATLLRALRDRVRRWTPGGGTPGDPPPGSWPIRFTNWNDWH
jgi:hypothetical protein